MLEKVKMYLDIGRILGQDKMLSLVKKEEAREIWLLLDEMNVNTNATSKGYCGDEKAKRCYFLKTELIGFGWEVVNTLEKYCRDLYFKEKRK